MRRLLRVAVLACLAFTLPLSSVAQSQLNPDQGETIASNTRQDIAIFRTVDLSGKLTRLARFQLASLLDPAERKELVAQMQVGEGSMTIREVEDDEPRNDASSGRATGSGSARASGGGSASVSGSVNVNVQIRTELRLGRDISPRMVVQNNWDLAPRLDLSNVLNRVDAEVRGAFESLNRFRVQGYGAPVNDPEAFVQSIVADRFDEALQYTVDEFQGRAINTDELQAVKTAFLVAFPQINRFDYGVEVASYFPLTEEEQEMENPPPRRIRTIRFEASMGIDVRIYNPAESAWEESVGQLNITGTDTGPIGEASLDVAIDDLIQSTGWYSTRIRQRFPVTSTVTDILDGGNVVLDAGLASDIVPGTEFWVEESAEVGGRIRKSQIGYLRVYDAFEMNSDAKVLWGDLRVGDSTTENVLFGGHFRFGGLFEAFLVPSRLVGGSGDGIGLILGAGAQLATGWEFGYAGRGRFNADFVFPLNSPSLAMINSYTLGLGYTIYLGRLWLETHFDLGVNLSLYSETILGVTELSPGVGFSAGAGADLGVMFSPYVYLHVPIDFRFYTVASEGPTPDSVLVDGIGGFRIGLGLGFRG